MVPLIDKRGKKVKNDASKKGKNIGVLLVSAPVLVVIVLMLAVISGLISFYLLMFLETKKGTVLLPNFIGTDVRTAEQKLRSMGFKIEKVGDSGKVINMDPPGNTVVKKGRKVKLFAENAVQKSLLIPDFKGTWYKSVQQLFNLMEIHSVIKKVPEGGLEGTVIQTSPTPGSKVFTGDIVTLFVSTGTGSAGTNSSENEDRPMERLDSTISEPQPGGTESALEVIPPSIPVESRSSQETKTEQETNESYPLSEGTPLNQGGQF
ncbi:PASTA domain-containing protein [Fervidobacterium changbaicum]|uniref:PASTA domain-containing protein n=1 Tax=Fervidobacterium changbaicum TaxID=310769 RepID=A0AAE5XC51_9BACT|nr:PASTA domain-containing protein [Fervidobacterium changbaicum]